MRIRSTLLLLLALCFAPGTLVSQELTFLNAVFAKVHKITVSLHGGELVSNKDLVAGDNCALLDLCGFASEVLIDVGGEGHLELGLGASYLRGFRATSDSEYEIHGGLRSVPTVSAYLSYGQWYGGVGFGISDLWNVQAYDQAGNEFAVKGQALEYGPTIGFFQNLFDLPVGMFVEANYRRRQFASLDWSNDTVKVHPREFSLDTWTLGVGLQINVREAAKQQPAFAGTWILARVDGQPLPAVWGAEGSGIQSRRQEIASGTLDLSETMYVFRVWERTAHYGEMGLISADHPVLQEITGTLSRSDESEDLRILEMPTGQPNLIVRRSGEELLLRHKGHLLAFARIGSSLPTSVTEPRRTVEFP